LKAPDVKRLLVRAREAYKERGIRCVVHSGIKVFFSMLISDTIKCYYYKMFKPKSFTFQGQIHNYFYHRYGRTWENERSVEVPIIWEMVKKYQEGSVLEVGNVLSHYFPVQHDILDKYEKAHGVINQDVVDFQPPKKYGLIVSISTLEHVGWDEKPKNPPKILHAIENLRTKCLAPRGKIVATLPLGYNSYMDKLLKKRKMPFTKKYYLKRVSYNSYIEVDWKDLCEVKFGHPFPYANGLVIGIIESD